jgi:hypothetical protein
LEAQARNKEFDDTYLKKYYCLSITHIIDNVKHMIIKNILTKEFKTFIDYELPKGIVDEMEVKSSLFYDFWKPEGKDKDHVAWTGSKNDARYQYEKRAAEFGHNYLMNRKIIYFHLIRTCRNKSGFDREVMGVSKFFGVDAHFQNDWESEIIRRGGDWRDVVPDTAPAKTIKASMTREDYNSLFEEDNN